MKSANIDRLRELVEARVLDSGAHLIDFVVRGERGTRVVEVFIDSESGVTSDICSAVSRGVGEAIDAVNGIDGRYRLDVSSPGIDRPLKFPWQYRKHIGRLLAVRMQPGHDPMERTGKLLAVDEMGIVLQSKAPEEELRIPFEALAEAKVKAPW